MSQLFFLALRLPRATSRIPPWLGALRAAHVKVIPKELMYSVYLYLLEKEKHSLHDAQFNIAFRTHLKLKFSVQHCVVTGFGQSGAPAKSFVT